MGAGLLHRSSVFASAELRRSDRTCAGSTVKGFRSWHAAVALSVMACGQSAEASEGGTSFYLLGSGGPGAALLPPVRGIFFDNNLFHYRGHSQATKRFVIGGSVIAGLNAKMDADFATVLWVPSTDFAGGTLGLGGTFVFGRPEANVGSVITGPRGRQIAISKNDNAWVVGDPVGTAELSWNLGGNAHVATIATANIPVGNYREDKLANLAFHRWVLDWSNALSWHDEKSGWDVSGKAGLTFNGRNHYTDYKTGTELHLEAAVERRLSKALSVGVQGYHFQQITGDSGAGAVLGPFEGRVSALGMTAGFNFMAGGIPLALRGRVFKEFGARNRIDNGTSMMLDLSFPLKVILPK